MLVHVPRALGHSVPLVLSLHWVSSPLPAFPPPPLPPVLDGRPRAWRCGVVQWLRNILPYKGGGKEDTRVRLPSPDPEPPPAAGGGGGHLLGLGQDQEDNDVPGDKEDEQCPPG